jgi:hypothetical protein
MKEIDVSSPLVSRRSSEKPYRSGPQICRNSRRIYSLRLKSDRRLDTEDQPVVEARMRLGETIELDVATW